MRLSSDECELIGLHTGDGTLCYGYQLRLFGKQRVNKFFKEVSPKNPKHLNKYFSKK